MKTLTQNERMGKPADASLLSAAYHNLAVQQERLGHVRGQVRSYRSAVQQARKGGRATKQGVAVQTQRKLGVTGGGTITG